MVASARFHLDTKEHHEESHTCVCVRERESERETDERRTCSPFLSFFSHYLPCVIASHFLQAHSLAHVLLFRSSAYIWIDSSCPSSEHRFLSPWNSSTLPASRWWSSLLERARSLSTRTLSSPRPASSVPSWPSKLRRSSWRSTRPRPSVAATSRQRRSRSSPCFFSLTPLQLSHLSLCLKPPPIVPSPMLGPSIQVHSACMHSAYFAFILLPSSLSQSPRVFIQRKGGEARGDSGRIFFSHPSLSPDLVSSFAKDVCCGSSCVVKRTASGMRDHGLSEME